MFEQDWRTFYPYSSKYDAYLAGQARLAPAERRGLELFDDPAKGNCAGCHISERGNDGTPPQFTDFGLIALGLPRNPAIPANADPAYFDLGLCGPLRTDLRAHADYCGRFRTPSLRNVALRRTFFHNGVVQELRKAVAFYATRDTNPERWYPRNPDGSVHKFDDLPPQYLENLSDKPPFDGRHPGDPPALTEAEIDDVVAFLGTLTDGWFDPAAASARPGDEGRRSGDPRRRREADLALKGSQSSAIACVTAREQPSTRRELWFPKGRRHRLTVALPRRLAQQGEAVGDRPSMLQVKIQRSVPEARPADAGWSSAFSQRQKGFSPASPESCWKLSLDHPKGAVGIDNRTLGGREIRCTLCLTDQTFLRDLVGSTGRSRVSLRLWRQHVQDCRPAAFR